MVKNLIGQRFNKLVIISKLHNEQKDNKNKGRNIWVCQCDCGNFINVPTNKLTTNNTKSCGCLKSEKSYKNIQKAIESCTKYNPSISSARRIWRQYKYSDPNCNINFEYFYEVSQKNCSYCGIIPTNSYNGFLNKKDASNYTKECGTFTYNGLDRVDSTKYHTIDNVVPCCYICNRAKNNRTLTEFKQYINDLTINRIEDFKYIPIDLPENRYVLQSVKSAYRSYEKEEISLEEFYSLSQMPCFYCNKLQINKVNAPMTDKKSSKKAKDEGWFLYNGIDRIDSAIELHSLKYCVTCCKYCNFAKGKVSFEYFHSWIKRIKNYQTHNKT